MICLSESGYIYFSPFTKGAISFSKLQSILGKRRISPRITKKMYMVLEGGEDISPYLYGESVRFSYASSTPSSRDILNYTMIRFAENYRIPVIGICRGHQIINAYCGGALYQDIYYDLGIHHPNRTHTVYLHVNNTTYRKEVNSIHHQAVKVVPDGANITAITEDGIIEGVYYPGSIFGTAMYGVQWHPEIMRDSELVQVILNVLYRDLHGYAPFTVNPVKMEELFSVQDGTAWLTELVNRNLTKKAKKEQNGSGGVTP